MIINHLTPRDIFLEQIRKTLNRNIELKAEITEKINTTYGGEKLSWIKKYNTLFINKWNQK
jgi:hypothetical protein